MTACKGRHGCRLLHKFSFIIAMPYPARILFIGLFLSGAVSAASGQTPAVDTFAPQQIREVLIRDQQTTDFAADRLKGVENFGIYKGKKNEVVAINALTANLSTNNPRQVYARVTGLNIWESDGAGLQLGIGGRGLSPNRTANFNTRQNGYDISADALGYPESYYTPPSEALERIEIVRGAASLQYGTQFGGLLNFRFRRGAADKPLEITTRQTVGSWGYFGSFNSMGGTVLKGKLNYYTFYQYKRGDGWRPNSHFDYHCAFASVSFDVSERFNIQTDLTKMSYLAQQPGGLTDKLFQDNPRQSVRNRNWFRVQWNLASLTASYRLSDRTRFNLRQFGLLAGRQSLGNLDRINVADLGQARTLINGEFRNYGQEGRLLHQFGKKGQTHTLLLGYRLYFGRSTAQQGDADAGNEANFAFTRPENLENSDYRFPNANQAIFAEQVFNLSSRWSLTPGIRFERIRTRASGYYNQRVLDAAGNIVAERRYDDRQERLRAFLIGGLGLTFIPVKGMECYGNFSQNYRAINFTDLRIVNPNFAVDSNLRDERGFTADLGIRSNKKSYFTYEITAFYVAYNGRIGQILKSDQPPLYNDYRFRTNVSDARNVGLEAFSEVELFQALGRPKLTKKLSCFLNAALVDARYINTGDNSIRNKKVEMAPPFMLRSGLVYRQNEWRAALQYSYVAGHYSDATNAVRTATAVEGYIPAYGVADFSCSWHSADPKRRFRPSVEFSCNNLFNAAYFTRRAESYPGPGIIPAEGRGFYCTVGASF